MWQLNPALIRRIVTPPRTPARHLGVRFVSKVSAEVLILQNTKSFVDITKDFVYHGFQRSIIGACSALTLFWRK